VRRTTAYPNKQAFKPSDRRGDQIPNRTSDNGQPLLSTIGQIHGKPFRAADRASYLRWEMYSATEPTADHIIQCRLTYHCWSGARHIATNCRQLQLYNSKITSTVLVDITPTSASALGINSVELISIDSNRCQLVEKSQQNPTRDLQKQGSRHGRQGLGKSRTFKSRTAAEYLGRLMIPGLTGCSGETNAPPRWLQDSSNQSASPCLCAANTIGNRAPSLNEFLAALNQTIGPTFAIPSGPIATSFTIAPPLMPSSQPTKTSNPPLTSFPSNENPTSRQSSNPTVHKSPRPTVSTALAPTNAPTQNQVPTSKPLPAPTNSPTQILVTG